MTRGAVQASAGATLFSLATLVSAVGLVGGCDRYNEPPFNPREMGRNTRLASKERVIRDKEPIPTTMQSRPSTRPSVRSETTEGAVEDEPTVRLSLQEIIQRAVASNSDVAVAGYEPAIEETRVIEAEARFDPTFFTSLTYAHEIVLSPSASSAVGINPFDPQGFESLAFQSGVRQNLYSGGTAELSTRLQRIRRAEGFADTFGGINPYYLNELILRVTQPLLRDFGAEINRARITIARNNQRISTLEFRRTLEEQIATVEQAYWQLVRAAQEVRVPEELLAGAVGAGGGLSARVSDG